MTTYYTDILNCSPDYILDNNLISECQHRAKLNDFKTVDNLVIKYQNKKQFKPILLFMKSFYDFYEYKSDIYTKLLSDIVNTENKIVVNQSVYDFITTLDKSLAEDYLNKSIYINKSIPIEFFNNLVLIPGFKNMR